MFQGSCLLGVSVLFFYGCDDCEGVGREFGGVCVVFQIRVTWVIARDFIVRNVCGSCNGELVMEW